MAKRQSSLPWKCTVDDCGVEAVFHECLKENEHNYYCEYHHNLLLGHEPSEKVKKYWNKMKKIMEGDKVEKTTEEANIWK